MVAEVFSAMIQGIEGQIVKIQVDISNGLPNFNMIGYLSNEVKESKERVRTALNNIGVLLPPKRISVNFAPADFRKCGTSFDIGVAAAILLAMDFVPETYIKDTLFVGELSLNGQICPISGVLPIVVAASKRGIKRCIVAQENVAEAAFVEQMEVIGCRNLEELFFYLKHGYIINDDSGEILENSGNISEDSGKECTIQDVKKSQEISESTRSLNLKSTVLVKDILENADEDKISVTDFSEVKGQVMAKRAMEIAAAGYHNLMLGGPPGVGKSMLALNAVCNFTKPPEYIEKELTQKSLDSISLTEAQEKVIGFRKGFARVNAGAGAGKTMCVALRTAFLLSEGVDPAKICLLTFTNTGAAEMKERIGLYCEDFGLNINLDTLTVTTFNSFGDKIIHKNYEELGFEKEPRLIDDIEQSKIVAEMLKDNVVADLDYRNFNMNMPFVKGALPTAKKAFEIIKRENLSNESDVDVLWEKMKNESYDIAKTAAAALIELYGEYDDQLRERSLIEYADQELLIFELLKKNPFYFEDYGFEHIIVDEFQDTSQLQFEILKNIINSSLEFKSFLVVGDDSQSIFGFRGSNPQFIIEFEEKLGERVQDFYLLENHRSTKSIIDFANKINSLNKNRVVKDLIPTREKGESVIVEAFEKKNEEEDHIVSIIKEKIDEGHPLEDIAYIASTRSQLLKMGTRLTEEGIQWIMLNPEPMFSNSRIEGALSLARYLADNTATKDLFVYLNAVNNSEILEKKTDEEILSFIEKQKTALSSFYSDVDDAVKRNWLINYLEYLKGHKEVSDEVYEAFLKKVLVWDTYEEMLEYMLDFGVYGEREAAKRCKDYPGVVLTTAHSSKGMEWPIVIDEISKYHDKNLRDEKDIEEKRRLFFVSATRARDELYVVAQRYAYGSKGNGKSIPDTRVQNIFLREAVWAVEQK